LFFAGLSVHSLILPSRILGQSELQSFLSETIEFDNRLMRELDEGRVVVRVLDTEPDEVATFGAYWVSRPAQSVLDFLANTIPVRDPETLPGVVRLSDPPTLADLEVLPIPGEEVEELRRCRPGSCPVKLTAEVFDALDRVDWNRPRAMEEVLATLREMMHGYATAYLEGGNSQLAVYQDKEAPAGVLAGLNRLLDQTPYLFVYVPEVLQHLLTFPDSRVRGTDDRLVWTLEDFGLRPVISLTHVTVFRTPGAVGGAAGILSEKQLYANHYFQAALAITAVVVDPSAGGRKTYVLELRRYLFDTRLGRLESRAVRSQLSDYVRSGLEAQRLGLDP
jgi:hypothetical protein